MLTKLFKTQQMKGASLFQGLRASFNFGKSRRAFCVVTSITVCSDTPFTLLMYSAETAMFLGSFLTCVENYKKIHVILIDFFLFFLFLICVFHQLQTSPASLDQVQGNPSPVRCFPMAAVPQVFALWWKTQEETIMNH